MTGTHELAKRLLDLPDSVLSVSINLTPPGKDDQGLRAMNVGGLVSIECVAAQEYALIFDGHMNQDAWPEDINTAPTT